jgi:hypothetical protein
LARPDEQRYALLSGSCQDFAESFHGRGGTLLSIYMGMLMLAGISQRGRQARSGSDLRRERSLARHARSTTTTLAATAARHSCYV